jgi:hypothetical protein
MNHGETKKEIIIAVIIDAMMRKGTYRRTLSQPSQLASWRKG